MFLGQLCCLCSTENLTRFSISKKKLELKFLYMVTSALKSYQLGDWKKLPDKYTFGGI